MAWTSNVSIFAAEKKRLSCQNWIINTYLFTTKQCWPKLLCRYNIVVLYGRQTGNPPIKLELMQTTRFGLVVWAFTQPFLEQCYYVELCNPFLYLKAGVFFLLFHLVLFIPYDAKNLHKMDHKNKVQDPTGQPLQKTEWSKNIYC